MRFITIYFVMLVVPGITLANDAPTNANKQSIKITDWPQFRGPHATGVIQTSVPFDWDVASGKNIRWTRKLEGLSHSCPIVSGGRVYLTNAIRLGQLSQNVPPGFLNGSGEPISDDSRWRWQVLCLDLIDGSEIWRRTVAEGKPTIKRHIKSTHANSTPATDGKHVVTCFGSEGLHCFDTDGQLLWSKNLGRLHSGPYDAPKLEWGFASSPVIHEGQVILQCDCLNVGFVAVFDIKDGREIRRIPRNDVATWSTPNVVGKGKESQLVCNGYKEMAGYDLKSGKRLWMLGGGGDVPVPTPLFHDDMILLTNAHGRSPLFAISKDARGDLAGQLFNTETSGKAGILWWQPRAGLYITTPLILGDLIYACSGRGILTVRELKTGEEVYKKRIGGSFSASPIATPNQIILASEDGIVTQVKPGRSFEQLSKHKFKDTGIFATPALGKDTLLIRTTKSLTAITEDTTKE